MEKNEKEYFVLYTPNEMNLAYDLFDDEFSKEQILNVLQSDDDIKKQVCLIKLQDISSKEDAKTLVSVLTGQSGPVREICSAKINDFLKNEEMREFFAGEEIREILMNGLNDIIPTVARNILEVIKFVPDLEFVKRDLLRRILDIDEEKEDVEALSNHEIIKQTFKLEKVMPKEIDVSRMDVDYTSTLASEIIKAKLKAHGGHITVYTARGLPCEIYAESDGTTFTSDKLPVKPAYDYKVFDDIVELLIKQGGRAKKGNGRNYKLGEPGCEENTVVGTIALHRGRTIGESVFDPVFVMAAILEWAGIAKNGRGELILTEEHNDL